MYKINIDELSYHFNNFSSKQTDYAKQLYCKLVKRYPQVEKIANDTFSKLGLEKFAMDKYMLKMILVFSRTFSFTDNLFCCFFSFFVV